MSNNNNSNAISCLCGVLDLCIAAFKKKDEDNKKPEDQKNELQQQPAPAAAPAPVPVPADTDNESERRYHHQQPQGQQPMTWAVATAPAPADGGKKGGTWANVASGGQQQQQQNKPAQQQQQQKPQAATAPAPAAASASVQPTQQELKDFSVAVQRTPTACNPASTTGGKKVYQEGDVARNPLFAHIDAAHLQSLPTFSRFIALLDNYEKRAGVTEQKCATEEKEQRDFIAALLATAPIRYAHSYLRARGLLPGGCD
ncbi:hypothetical protein HDU96_003946, partial [Phlyctochytrium bullatum]